jgi:hypothetical protein
MSPAERATWIEATYWASLEHARSISVPPSQLDQQSQKESDAVKIELLDVYAEKERLQAKLRGVYGRQRELEGRLAGFEGQSGTEKEKKRRVEDGVRKRAWEEQDRRMKAGFQKARRDAAEAAAELQSESKSHDLARQPDPEVRQGELNAQQPVAAMDHVMPDAPIEMIDLVNDPVLPLVEATVAHRTGEMMDGEDVQMMTPSTANAMLASEQPDEDVHQEISVPGESETVPSLQLEKMQIDIKPATLTATPNKSARNTDNLVEPPQPATRTVRRASDDGSPPLEPVSLLTLARSSVGLDHLPFHIYDGFGVDLGSIRPLPTSHRWSEALLKLPIKRDVHVRPGRVFPPQTLDTIYKRQTEHQREFRWLSVMVQATGEVQNEACEKCARGLGGVWRDCVRIPGEEFPRCGNCEWAKEVCIGGSLGAMDSMVDEEDDGNRGVVEVEDGDDADIVDAVEESEILDDSDDGDSDISIQGSAEEDSDEDDNDLSKALRRGQRPVRLHAARTRSLLDKSDEEQAETEEHAQVPAQGSKLREERQQERKREQGEQLKAADGKAMIMHSSRVFTDPPLMQGVPLAKISPDHLYWDNAWDNLEAHLEKALQIQEEDHSPVPRGSQTRQDYRANHKINQRRISLDFVKRAEFSPFQLVGKGFTPATFPDQTIYKLARLMKQLEGYEPSLGVKPVQWVRQRLCEIKEELDIQGKPFDLIEILDNINSDAKLDELRQRHSVKTVGRRPRSSSQAPKPPEKLAEAAPPDTPSSKTGKPKGFRAHWKLLEENWTIVESISSRRLSRPERPRTPALRNAVSSISPAITPSGRKASSSAHPSDEADFVAEGYTSTDSFTGQAIKSVDYHLSQVKTATGTTPSNVTQYWHWYGGKERFYEHSVLAGANEWFPYAEPYDFDVRLVEVQGVEYSRGSLRVLVRGKAGMAGGDGKTMGGKAGERDVFVEFKRERTKKRFLRDIRKKGVTVTRKGEREINGAWEAMQSELLPGMDEEMEDEEEVMEYVDGEEEVVEDDDDEDEDE